MSTVKLPFQMKMSRILIHIHFYVLFCLKCGSSKITYMNIFAWIAQKEKVSYVNVNLNVELHFKNDHFCYGNSLEKIS